MSVIGGQPVLSSMRLVYHFKLDLPGAEATFGRDGDFLLKAEFIRLFEIMRGLKSGTVRRIEIRHGLPAVMEFVEDLAEAMSGPLVNGVASDV